MSDCEIQKGEILLSSSDWQVEGIDGRDQHWWKSGMHLCSLKTMGIAKLGCYISKELSHFVLKIGLLDSLSWRLLVCSNWTKQKWGGGPWQLCFFNKLFEVDNNLEVVEDIVYENLEDLIDGLKECNVTRDYIFEAEKFYEDCIASCE